MWHLSLESHSRRTNIWNLVEIWAKPLLLGLFLLIVGEVATSDGMRQEQEEAMIGDDEEQATLTIEEASIKDEATDDQWLTSISS